ncbi:helix-turn-helix domain-containing protein [Psychroflexus aestuariivivens]|uniref:helix-turn-helix domain-containing protein n=1 Tax=Psychroflexus aestuariivivens TaxID=1795040 RepID=UPI00130047B6|nr:helix-turn-helix transcriptional regulator [Psychroflexus aestuariivivens]
MAYCNTDESEKYINLFVDLFKQSANVNQLLHAISIEIRRADRSEDNKQFFIILKKIITKIETKYPELKKDLRFINLNYVFLTSQSTYQNACDYLISNHVSFNENYHEKLEVIFHYVSLSNCAAYREDFNSSILALINGLAFSKKLEKPYNRLKKGHFLKLLSMRYYDIKDYNKSLYYANASIETFKPEYNFTTGIGVAYEQKGLAYYQLFNKLDSVNYYFDKAQQIHKNNNNLSRSNYVYKLKSEANLETNSDLAKRYFFEFFNYFQKNNRNNHRLESWLLANKILHTYRLNKLQYLDSQIITHRQVVDTLAAFLPRESLKNQLEISSVLINYYKVNFNKDSLIKYNQLQNELEFKRNQLNIQQKQTNVNLYLTNYQKEQELANLNLLNQERSYQNKLLISLICFVVLGSAFYYFYKRKQKQMMLSQLQLKEAEHDKLKTKQKLKEELILRKEQNEKMLKLAYDNELKGKELLQLQLQKKQNEVEAVQLEKQTSANLLNEVFSALKDEKVNDANLLVRKLQTNRIITQHHNSLKEIFESISPNFMHKLNKINSSLTEQDVLYCALIRQKYTTKQIANFLNISPKSVNQHKYRLKKKLAIDKEQGINEYIANLESK